MAKVEYKAALTAFCLDVWNVIVVYSHGFLQKNSKASTTITKPMVKPTLAANHRNDIIKVTSIVVAPSQ
jgi:hypothetical protein